MKQYNWSVEKLSDHRKHRAYREAIGEHSVLCVSSVVNRFNKLSI